MNNKIISIILSIILLLPAASFAIEETALQDNNPVAIEEVTEDISVEQPQEENLEMSSDSKQVSEYLPYKQPISKRKLIKKFLLAMFAVGLSSVILYLGLTIYNRVRCGVSVQVKTPKGETPLSSPDSLEEAAKTFLDKTKWV